MNQKKKVSNFGEKKFRKLAKPSGMELYNSKPQGKKKQKEKKREGWEYKTETVYNIFNQPITLLAHNSKFLSKYCLAVSPFGALIFFQFATVS